LGGERGGKLLCGPGRPGGSPRRHCLRAGRPRPGTPGPAEARRAEGRRLWVGGSEAPGPRWATLEGGIGAAGARHRRPGAPLGSLRCAPDPWGEVWSPSGAFLNHLVRRGRLGGLGWGLRSWPRSWGPSPRRVGARAPLEPRVLLLRAAGLRRARPGGRGSGARHSQVPSAAGPRTEDLFFLLLFFGSVGGPVTGRWGLTTKLRARELAARQPWKRDKSGTVCRRKFLMQLSAFADCLSKRLPGEGPRACALWK
jgi:hypothetical protein